MTEDNASYFARLSRELMDEETELPTLEAVVSRAVEVVSASEHASITIRRRNRHMETIASTSHLASRCDALQYALDEGPCLESVATDEVHVSNDLGTSERWPSWGPQAAQLGARSVLSVQLSTDRDVIGALNLYAERQGAFDADAVDLALIYATHATNALAASRLIAGLRTAVDSRHRIGIAQGVLMNTYGLTMDQSFELLRRYSSQTNTKLREVADYVVEQGELPEQKGSPRIDPDL